MNGPHIKVIEPTKIETPNGVAFSTVFYIGEEDVANLNLVSIHSKIYPVYKDHIGYYILMNGVRIDNGTAI